MVQRLTQVDIDREINEAYMVFGKKIFEAEELPDKFRELFISAVMSVPPSSHQIHSDVIKSIFERSDNAYTNIEVGMMVNVILSVPPQEIFTDVFHFVNTLSQIEDVRKQYNAIKSAFDKEMISKKVTLLKLSGLSSNTAHFPIGSK